MPFDPSYVIPFVLAILAAGAGRFVVGRPVRDDPNSFPGWILYAVAIGCVVIGIAAIFLSRA